MTGLPVFAEGWDLERVVRDQGVEHVVLTFSAAPEEVHLRLLKRCDELGIPNSLVPRLYEKSTEHVRVVPLGGLPLVARHSPNPKSWVFALKHGIDRLAAAVAILVLSPLLGALALGVWLTLGRPIFYRAERVGRDGKRFDMLKFRTMLPMTDEERTNLVIDPNTGTGGISVNGLDRRTPLGHAYAPHVSGRASPALQRPQGRHEPGRPPSRADRVRRGLREGSAPLRRAAPRQVGNHRPGAGQRAPWDDVACGSRRVRQLLHRELVALARRQDHGHDVFGSRSLGQRRVTSAHPALQAQNGVT